MPSPTTATDPNKWPHLIAISIACLLGMSPWFSATAVVPALMDYWDIGSGEAAWLTMAVQGGFVVGALLSALLNVPDLWEPRRVFAFGALTAALSNAAIPAFHVDFNIAVALRFLTGVSLALVYPVGMKIMATWTQSDRGMAIGMLVGALTVGKAAPHLVKALGNVSAWEPVVHAVSGLALLGGVIAWLAGKNGPYASPTPRFHWRHIGKSLRVRSLRLANYGYLGHMWELYAMWTWIPLFLLASFRASGMVERFSDATIESLAALAAFAVIGAGGIGSFIAGLVADRWGRSKTAIASLITSGACAASIGFLFGASPILVSAIALIWGFSVVADSAQFSASVSELADREYIGTQLTTQTALGFLLTLISIRLIPAVLDFVGWEWTFVLLVPGPIFGIWSMWRLMRSPDATKLAGGRG
ncbi:MAG: MFS transporter [Gemmatimonadota bacterium]|nr:MAG: MFS transporter [Gemmatimonadota bacterium]